MKGNVSGMAFLCKFLVRFEAAFSDIEIGANFVLNFLTVYKCAANLTDFPDDEDDVDEDADVESSSGENELEVVEETKEEVEVVFASFKDGLSFLPWL